MTSPLAIISAGLCCPVGANLAATDCALRAGLNHFQESDFIASNGQPVRVARLPDIHHWGTERLGRWCATAIQECLNNAPVEINAAQLPLLLLTAERSRPNANDAYYEAIYNSLISELDSGFDTRTQLITAGRAGIGLALQYARQWLQDTKATYVLIAGVDSYLDSQSINHYLKEDRLLVYGTSDGFLPGEAAAAILVGLKSTTPCVGIYGIGEGNDINYPDGKTPSIADGHTQAMRQAFKEANVALEHFECRFSDQNGETFFARDLAHALTRVGIDGLPKLPAITLADCVGEIGAATGPLMLAWASHLLLRHDESGLPALATFANDDGLRCALVLNHI